MKHMKYFFACKPNALYYDRDKEGLDILLFQQFHKLSITSRYIIISVVS